MTHRLAIIIPAYKAAFLSSALDSIAAQTCKDFTLYVGDDCSPESIGSIVDGYQGKIDLVYHRFDTNIGGVDLVAQWERCIALSRGEDYIWLFSDDDVMEPDCVEALFRQIKETRESYDLYHFDVSEIDEKGEVTRQLPGYPPVLSAYAYYKGKSSGRYRSYVVENVFSRSVYEQCGGFRNFDLAWGSDVATWCIFSEKKGMCKVPDARVRWRRSGQNITPDKSGQTVERKLKSRCASLSWAYHFFKGEDDILETNRRIFIRVMRHYKPLVGKECFDDAYKYFCDSHGYQDKWRWMRLFIVLPKPLYRLLKKR